MKNKNESLFSPEHRVVKNLETFLINQEHSKDELVSELEAIKKKYERLLKQTERMTSTADANQKKILDSNDHTRELNRQLNIEKQKAQDAEIGVTQLNIELALALEETSNLQKELQASNESLEIVNDNLTSEKIQLSRYFPKDVVELILKGDMKTNLGGSITEATIMFMDIRGSTSLAEKIKPEQLVELLNLFFVDVFDIIFGSKGSVNKMLGDGILATFGCPNLTKEDAINSASAALKILKHCEMFNQFKPDYLKDDLKIGIGIASGKVFAGNIGSIMLMEYTVIGDPVNLASRLETLTKKYSSNILIDGQTNEKLKNNFKTTFLHKAKIRGKDKIIKIYSLDDFKD